jgi:glutamate/tyrosine decarboxylase-like PLP-dependent enzyme
MYEEISVTYFTLSRHISSNLLSFYTLLDSSCSFKVPAYDFSVDGVTSISADAHKVI